MDMMLTAMCFITAYLVGAIPFAYIAGKVFRGIDIRDFGSGNVGATNVVRTLGKGPGILVLLCDMAKGMAAVRLVPLLFGAMITGGFPISDQLVHMICGVLAVAGHIWTVFLRFKGGKGVATTVGAFFGLTLIGMLIGLAVFFLVAYVTRYISAGSISLGISLFVANLLMSEHREYIILSGALAVLIIYTHRANIRRLIKGTEQRVGKAEATEENVS